MYLLFWLSLVPFATGRMGEGGFASSPTAVYGAVLLMAGLAYGIYVLVALTWIVPDRRIERAVTARDGPQAPHGTRQAGRAEALALPSVIRWRR
jgi:hypothetical protein